MADEELIDDSEFLAKRRGDLGRKIAALFQKTQANGCTEEEEASAISLAMKLMHENDISEMDISGEPILRKTYVAVELNLKYGNKWRWELVNTLAFNTGVYATITVNRFNDKHSYITFYGQEHTVAAAKIIAEHLVNTVERLSSQYAKETGSGQTGRRQFARGCSYRLRVRIQNSANLTHDVRLPAILKSSVQDAKEHYFPSGAGLKSRRGRAIDLGGIHGAHGYQAAEAIELRKRTEQLK